MSTLICKSLFSEMYNTREDKSCLSTIFFLTKCYEATNAIF